MSHEKLHQEAIRWYRQGVDDLEAAQAQFSPLLELTLALDKLYIPTRYPDALAELTPGEAFTQREAESALAAAEQILHHVQQWLQRNE